MSNDSPNLCKRVVDILKQEGLNPAIFKSGGDDWDTGDIVINVEVDQLVGITYETDPNNDGVSLLYDIVGGIASEAHDKAESLGPPLHPRELMAFQHSIALVLEEHSPYMVLLSIDESGRLIYDVDIALKTGIVDKFEPQYLKAGADFENVFRIMVQLYKANYSPDTGQQKELAKK